LLGKDFHRREPDQSRNPRVGGVSSVIVLPIDAPISTRVHPDSKFSKNSKFPKFGLKTAECGLQRGMFSIEEPFDASEMRG